VIFKTSVRFRRGETLQDLATHAFLFIRESLREEDFRVTVESPDRIQTEVPFQSVHLIDNVVLAPDTQAALRTHTVIFDAD